MESVFSFVPAYLYSTVYLYVVVMLCLITSFVYVSSNGQKCLKVSNTTNLIPTFILSILIILFLGLRPFTKDFGDTSMYVHWYNNVLDFSGETIIGGQGEWLWDYIATVCQSFGLEATYWLLVIEVLYVGLMFACCWRLMSRNVWVAMLFCLISFSFYSYGINGIRNGLACSIVMLALSLLSGNTIEKIISLVLLFCAYNIHHSTALPSLCAIVSLFVVKQPRHAIGFWLASIIISLLVGNAIGDLFASMGFDDRTHYFEDAEETASGEMFSSTGFRFDFLLYSAMPVLMVWYLTVKRNFNDVVYNIIANTYILANAFWIMVIRASYSNRFAYLSWFLYPLVIAYPLLRMNIWDDQDRKTALILLAYSGFTFVMHFV